MKAILAALSPRGLAQTSARRPWLTVALWALLLVAALVSASSLSFTEDQSIIGAESTTADDLLEDLRGPEPPTETVIVRSLDGATVDDGAFERRVDAIVEELRALGVTANVVSYYETRDETLVSQDRTILILPVVVTGSIQDAPDTVAPIVDVVERNADASFETLTLGTGSMNREFIETYEKDLRTGEMIGIPAALIILLLVFGAAVAAGVPIVLSLVGIIAAVGITAVFSRFMGITSMSINMITMIGLAVGIDYSLFIVERFREERARGLQKVDAVVKAGDTASRAVLFSGITVIIALCGMLVVPATMFHGLAIGAIAVVFAAVAAALTLLPAVLSLLGDRVNWLHLPGRGASTRDDDDSGFWGRTTAAVMSRPLVAIAATVALLIAAAAPVVTMKLGSPGLGEAPAELASVQAFHVLDAEFSAGRVSPTHVMVRGDLGNERTRAALVALQQSLLSDPDVAEVGALQESVDGKVANLPVIINGDAIGADARATIDRIRNEYVPQAFDGAPADVYVGGTSAGTADYVDAMATYLPIVMAFVLALSFVLLMVVFHSIVIPVKAIVMNLLSVGAAYGLIVLVFQHGVGADVLGFQQSDSTAAFLPIFLFAILFGLSMDYHVFLLSRIQERFMVTRDNRGAVSYGLRSTAHIITGAAAIMMAVFGGFAMGSMVDLQQVGFGLAVAVFIDATIVRSVLVPASMEMLGEWNWYLPRWLSWLPRIDVEGAPAARAPEARTAPALQPPFQVAGGS